MSWGDKKSKKHRGVRWQQLLLRWQGSARSWVHRCIHRKHNPAQAGLKLEQVNIQIWCHRLHRFTVDRVVDFLEFAMKFVLSDLWQSDSRSHQRSLCTVTPQLVMFQWGEKKTFKCLQLCRNTLMLCLSQIKYSTMTFQRLGTAAEQNQHDEESDCYYPNNSPWLLYNISASAYKNNLCWSFRLREHNLSFILLQKKSTNIRTVTTWFKVKG